ncbi:hypothetical protein POM88_050259 [Heracleum sosnowskyi]|uniref:Transposase (putative) gypsy type domain-containing protein n=1 Tax=Heracleum sosnowskyi TaxID=360622 RepID=A0AAD8M2H0_9APIA|nr:hypothetical protein POM88_050259 [Heracleum sosnowskyi]
MVGPSSTLAQKMAARAKKGNNLSCVPVVIDEPLPTLFELVNQMGDAFPNNAEFDSFKFPSTPGKVDVKRRKKYSFPKDLKIVVPDPGDRTCNWNPERLFVYRDAIAAGLRFPLHPFVVRLLAELRINPCQLYPNSWKFIFIFMARCLKEGIPLSVPIFRSIFVLKNSPVTRKGWVCIQHRPGVNHICNNASLPDSNHEWRHHFVVLYWKGGDWGQYFRSDFNHVVDFGSHINKLKSHEFPDMDDLITGHDHIHYRSFLTERIMVEVGMSRLSLEAAEALDREPGMGEQVTKRMVKKAEFVANPPPPKVPDFLTHSQKAGKRFRDSEGIIKTTFQPAWGICGQDSIVGSSLLAMDWSRFSITPPDMVNVLARSKLDETEQMGTQAIYQLNSYFQTSIHQGKSLRDELRAANKEKSRVAQ